MIGVFRDRDISQNILKEHSLHDILQTLLPQLLPSNQVLMETTTLKWKADMRKILLITQALRCLCHRLSTASQHAVKIKRKKRIKIRLKVDSLKNAPQQYK